MDLGQKEGCYFVVVGTVFYHLSCIWTAFLSIPQ